MPLDLTFSDEQNMLRDMVRGVCEQHGSLARLRELEDDPHGFSPDLWRQLGELDLLGVLVPAEYGGLGMTLTDAVVLYEEFGRLLVPSPHFVSAVLAAGILSRAGSVDQRETWLPAIASGSSIVGLAVAIPAVIGYNILQRSVKNTVARSTALGHALVGHLRAGK